MGEEKNRKTIAAKKIEINKTHVNHEEEEREREIGERPNSVDTSGPHASGSRTGFSLSHAKF